LAGDARTSFTVDTDAPTVLILDVTPDPRNTAFTAMTIVFSEPVTGLNLADLRLTRDGGGNLLTAAQTLTTADNITWTLGCLAGLTGVSGTYTLTLTAAGSGIIDDAGNALVGDARTSFAVDTIAPPAAPGGLTATAVSRSQINLSWTDN